MTLITVTLFLNTRLKDYFIWLNIPRSPGRAIDKDRESPMTRCHLSMPLRSLLQGVSKRISLKQVFLCWGKHNSILTMLINYPKSTWNVDQVQYPASRFFRNRTSFFLTCRWCPGVRTFCPVYEKNCNKHGTT